MITLRKNEMEWLENRVMVEIREDINFIKKVGLARNQVRGVEGIKFVQNVGCGQRFHSGISSMDFQHTAEHHAARRHTFHSPNFHYTGTWTNMLKLQIHIYSLTVFLNQSSHRIQNYELISYFLCKDLFQSDCSVTEVWFLKKRIKHTYYC